MKSSKVKGTVSNYKWAGQKASGFQILLWELNATKMPNICRNNFLTDDLYCNSCLQQKVIVINFKLI